MDPAVFDAGRGAAAGGAAVRLVDHPEVERMRAVWARHHRACATCHDGPGCDEGSERFELWQKARWELHRGVCALTSSERLRLLELVGAEDDTDHRDPGGVPLA